MAGQSAKATVTVSPGGGFTGVVALTCSVSPTPALAPTCSLNPAQVQVASGGQATSTLTVNTTGPTAYLGQPTLRRERIPIHAAMIPIFVMGLVGVGWRIGRGTKKKVIGLVICALLVGGEVFQVSCGGGGSRGTGTTGTPAGNYTVSVIASSGSMQHTASLTLTVQ